MANKIGYDCKLYRNTGSYGSPTWNEIAQAKNVTFNAEVGEADASRRASAWNLKLPTLKDFTIDLELLWDTSDADFTALQQAFFAGTSIEIMMLDASSATSGAQGPRATVMVASLSRTENLEDAVMAAVTLKPTPATNGPAWVTI